MKNLNVKIEKMKTFKILLPIICFVLFSVSLSNCKKDPPAPVAGFTFSGNEAPAPCEIIFTNTSTNSSSYIWDFGDGTTSTEQNTKHTFTKGGVYIVRLSANGDGGSNAISKNVTIKFPLPIANFTYTGDNNPAPCEVNFINTSTNSTSFSWDFGDGTSSTEKDIKHNYLNSGTFTVKLIATGNGETSSVNKNIIINDPVPVSDFSFTGGNCNAPCQVNFTNNSTNANSYYWDFGDGTYSTALNPIHVYTYGGTFSVKLSATGNSGTNSTTKNITIYFPAPTAYFTYTGGNCTAPCQVSFINTSTNATSYYWEFDDGTTSTQQSPNHVFVNGGIYNVKLTAYGDGGSDYFNKSVSILYPSTGTDVTFYNPTYTSIYITLNGSTQTILSGSSVTFYSVPGYSASYYAYTNGKTTSGTQVGLLIEWSNIISLPGGSLSYNLNITNDYFFLYIKNDGTHTLSPIYVNYGTWNETIDYVLVPDNGVKYRLGYYRAYSSTEVRGYYDDAPSYYTYWYNLNFPWTDNQSVELNNSYKSQSGIDNTHTKGQASKSLFPAENIRKRINLNEKAINVKCK
jgi:PKD repeat protein